MSIDHDIYLPCIPIFIVWYSFAPFLVAFFNPLFYFATVGRSKIIKLLQSNLVRA